MIAFWVALAVPRAATPDEGGGVDLALVLAVDCSFSVDSREFRLQMQGLGKAFLRPEVWRAIGAGPRQRIAVMVFQWSDQLNQRVVVPWTTLSGEADARALGLVLQRTPRQIAQGGTALADALMFLAEQLAAGPRAARLVIDVSSDGRNNTGPPVSLARDRIVASGITINALPILNEWPTLDVYFENQVAGGAGHFVLPANDYEAYGEAIFRKLLREITGPGVS